MPRRPICSTIFIVQHPRRGRKIHVYTNFDLEYVKMYPVSPSKEKTTSHSVVHVL